MSLSPEWLDELRNRTQMSALVGKTLKLVKAGREMKGCCPFHGEKTPSFYVNDDKGFGHCFGCAWHGDVIRWLTDHRGLPFMDAVRELAQAAGMDIPASSVQDKQARTRQNDDLGLLDRAQQWFVKQLVGDEAQSARQWLADVRKISSKVLIDFGYGFAPGNGTALRDAFKDVPITRLVELSLVTDPEGDKEPRDFFRRRVMIPIRDQRGRVIAFAGRALGDAQPKYLNSRAGPTFDKGATLYNIDKAAVAARKTGNLVIVEGYTDAQAFTAAGIEEAVAVCGTALTERHIALAWRLSNCPICCYDNDKAGRAAAVKAATRALPGLTPGRTLGFMFPASGKDPDDLLREHGPAAVSAILKQSKQTISDILFDFERAAAPLDSPEARAGFKHRLRDICSAIHDRSVAEEYWATFREKIDELFQRTAPPPRNRGEKLWKMKERAPSNQCKGVQSRGLSDSVARAVLCGLIVNHHSLASLYEQVAQARFEDPEFMRLRDVLVDLAIEGVTSDMDTLERALMAQGVWPAVEAARQALGPLPFSFLKVGHPSGVADLESALTSLQ